MARAFSLADAAGAGVRALLASAARAGGGHARRRAVLEALDLARAAAGAAGPAAAAAEARVRAVAAAAGLEARVEAARRVVEGELLLVDGRRDVADRVRAVLDECFLRAVEVALDVVARPGPDPELDAVVVGRRREDVAHGVEVHVPDGLLVRVVRVQRRVAAEEPVVHAAVVRAAAEDAAVEGVPGDGRDLAVVALEGLRVLEHADVVELERVVARRRQKPVRVDGVPEHLHDRVLVAVQGRDAGPLPRVPHLHLVVLGARRDELVGRVPGARLHVPAVAREDPLLLEELPVPDAHRAVVRAGAELGVGRREVQAAHGLALVRA
mmetsp:Transcript_11496/g.37685  ORF Transcript_11496/g.37685 Transcript_11496/m.37685 type:complete len:325 (+) Transcript_11496:122-1096(+)